MAVNYADVVFYGGDVITVNERQPLAESLAVKDGRIVYVGSLEGLDRFIGDDTRRVDLNRGALLPGFIEAHTHPILAAIQHHHFIDVSGFHCRTKKEVYDRIRNAIARTPNGEGVKVVGFDPNLVPDLVPPTLKELDELSTKHPISITTQTAHHGYYNSLVFKLAKVDKYTPNPPDGEYCKDAEGNLTGRVNENRNALERIFTRPTDSIGIPLLRKQFAEYSSHGFTTVAALGLFPIFKHSIDIVEQEVMSSKCPIRMAVYMKHDLLAKRPIDSYVHGQPGREAFCRVGVKWWADGSPHSGTMATAEPYLDNEFTRTSMSLPPTPWRGILNHKTQALYDDMLQYHSRHWQLAVHAHGERAIQQVLDVYERLLRTHPRRDHRYRLEHCGLITDSQLERCKQLGVTPSFFVDHIHYYGERLRDDILGPERAARFVPLGSASRTGLKWTLHSDSPCMPLGTFRAIKTAVTRMPREAMDDVTKHDVVIGPEQRVTIDDAIKAYTINAAWQIFHEDSIGSLEVGKMADLVIVDKNPYKVSPLDLDTIQIRDTFKSGISMKTASGNL